MTATEGNAETPKSGCLTFTRKYFGQFMKEKRPSNSIEDTDQDEEQESDEEDTATVSSENSEDESTGQDGSQTDYSQCQECKQLLRSLNLANAQVQKKTEMYDQIKSEDNAKISSLQEEIAQLKKQLSQRADGSIAKHEGRQSGTEELKREIEKQKHYIEKQKSEIQRLTQKLAAEMNTKIASDESNLENINIFNRPMNIASDYELLASNEWLGAKTELDEQFTDDEDSKIKFLCDIMLVGERSLQKMYQRVMGQCMSIIMQPLMQYVPVTDKEQHIETQDDNISCSQKEELAMLKDIPQALEIAVGDIMRRNADQVHMEPAFAAIGHPLAVKHANFMANMDSGMPELNIYINSCANLAWKMAIQRPPMTFSTPGIGKAWDEKTQTVAYNSDDPEDPAAAVEYYQHPVLLHGGNLMIKGKVITRKTSCTDV